MAVIDSMRNVEDILLEKLINIQQQCPINYCLLMPRHWAGAPESTEKL